ncbi:MAG: ABC transporter substrate-binding protein [Deltaproteobacteria bacterium]|nr:ABC transporter substrate-binding protein [Deltaproteobacteria bacterium]MBW2387591.1 ABC transporter substrate-binding protein [Deltaproteobacteria bacterium]
MAGCDAEPEPAASRLAPAPDPQRIVSLSPEVSQILLDLGVGARIIAVDSASGELSGFTDPVDLGSLEEASARLVSELQPDLTIGLADDRSRAFAKTLETLGTQVTLLDPRDANQADAAVLQIGLLVGREMRAQILMARRARDVSQIATRRDGRSRLQLAFVIGCDPLTVAGGAGLIHESLELAGAENVFHREGLAQRTITGTELSERSPEVVLDASGRGSAARCFDATAWGARVESVPTRFAALPALDLFSRVQGLHEILYPNSP